MERLVHILNGCTEPSGECSNRVCAFPRRETWRPWRPVRRIRVFAGIGLVWALKRFRYPYFGVYACTIMLLGLFGLIHNPWSSVAGLCGVHTWDAAFWRLRGK